MKIRKLMSLFPWFQCFTYVLVALSLSRDNYSFTYTQHKLTEINHDSSLLDVGYKVPADLWTLLGDRRRLGTVDCGNLDSPRGHELWDFQYHDGTRY